MGDPGKCFFSVSAGQEPSPVSYYLIINQWGGSPWQTRPPTQSERVLRSTPTPGSTGWGVGEQDLPLSHGAALLYGLRSPLPLLGLGAEPGEHSWPQGEEP